MKNKTLLTHGLWAFLFLTGGTLLAETSIATNIPVRHVMEQLTRAQQNSKFPAECFVPHSPEERKLQVGDVVEVGIFGQRDTVAKAIPIAPDGKLYYMFLPGIQAEGRKAVEVANEMESKLSHLFNNPQVSIIPKQFISNRFAILGKVNVGSLYPLETAITVRQAIARAEGIQQGF